MAGRNTPTPNQFLAKWLKDRGISKSQANRDLLYQSNYVEMVTTPRNKPRRPVTFDFCSRLIMAYGLDGPGLDLLEMITGRKIRR